MMYCVQSLLLLNFSLSIFLWMYVLCTEDGKKRSFDVAACGQEEEKDARKKHESSEIYSVEQAISSIETWK